MIVELNPKGLFGGLVSEINKKEDQLAHYVRKYWRLPKVESLQDLGDWRRGGAETYIAEAIISSSDGVKTKVIAKAFVGIGLKPSDQQQRWLLRRALLSSKGVRVPRLYAQYPGMIVEEFIEHEPRAIGASGIAFQLGQVASVLLAQRFNPVCMINDTRFSDDRVCYIDFGSDLGGEGQSEDDSWINGVRLKLPSGVRNFFEKGLRAGFS